MQSFSAGVGNWVADEILYQARIHPEQKANTLSEEQSGALHEQMQVMSPACLACCTMLEAQLFAPSQGLLGCVVGHADCPEDCC